MINREMFNELLIRIAYTVISISMACGMLIMRILPILPALIVSLVALVLLIGIILIILL